MVQRYPSSIASSTEDETALAKIGRKSGPIICRQQHAKLSPGHPVRICQKHGNGASVLLSVRCCRSHGFEKIYVIGGDWIRDAGPYFLHDEGSDIRP
jgi:hypothetical protein